MLAVVDTSTQLSNHLCKEMGLKTKPIQQMLRMEGTGSIKVLYLGYVKAHL